MQNMSGTWGEEQYKKLKTGTKFINIVMTNFCVNFNGSQDAKRFIVQLLSHVWLFLTHGLQQDTWPNIILGASMRVFLEEINIWLCCLSEVVCPHWCGLTSSNQLKAWINQIRWPSLESGENLSCLCIQSEASTLPGSQDSWSSD